MYKRPIRSPLDSSALMHLAVFPDGKPNLFRINFHFDEPIDPALLQQAVEGIYRRFPGIIAGIRAGFFRYYAQAVAEAPRVREDREIFALMSREELENCAMRILYKGCRLSLECFHSITDGSGALSFMNSLAAEYLRLRYSTVYDENSGIILPESPIDEVELEDSFLRHAGKKKAAFSSTASYQLPGDNFIDTPVIPTTGVFEIAAVLSAARENGVSVAAFMSAVMARALMRIQLRHAKTGEKLRPVQLMVPADLRRKFESRSLKNFSLYALPQTVAADMELSFRDFARKIAAGINAQLSEERLRGMMASTAALEASPLLRFTPLVIKRFALRMGYRVFGARTSCLTVTNLGAPHIPAQTRAQLQRLDLLLTPRICSPYNCGIISYGEKLYVCFSRNCPEPELETEFFSLLNELGVHGKVENHEN